MALPVVKVKGALEGYKLLPFHDTAVELVVGDGERECRQVLTLEGVLAFLATPLEHKPLKVFWDLDQSVASILRLLGPDMCKQLYETNKCYPKPFSIFYLPGKVFSVKHAAFTRASFYGIKQYFPDTPEPRGTKELCGYGTRLLEALKKMGLQPRKLTSPIAIWEDCVMSRLDLPTYRDAPDKANIYSWRGSGQLWVEAHKLGYWDEEHPVFDYDISGCFPNIAKNLIDLRHCKWGESDEYEAGAYYGYCHGVVTIYDWVKCSPILYASKDGLLISPVGTWEAWLNKAQIDFIREWGIGEFRIIDGVWAFPTKITYPLRLVMERLLRYKEHEDDVVRTLAKGQSVGIYGYMLAEYKDRFGPYWNPVWGDEISTGGGLEVAEWLYSHGIGPGDNEGYQTLICVNVDGVTLDKEVVL